MELAHVDQGYTGEQAAQDAAIMRWAAINQCNPERRIKQVTEHVSLFC